MCILLGNLSVNDIEKRTGVSLSEKDKEYINANRQEDIGDRRLEKGKWHCYDIPFVFLVSDKKSAEQYIEIFASYDWSDCLRPLQIGYEREE